MMLNQGKDTQDRVPPGQTLTQGFPVLHYGDVPITGIWANGICGFSA